MIKVAHLGALTGKKHLSCLCPTKFRLLLLYLVVQFSSVQSLSRVRLFAAHESQHARLPCPSPTPGIHSNSCPSSQWCHPSISSSVVPFYSCPQSLPASESFPMSQLFTWGGQSTGASASASFLPMNTQDWSPLEWRRKRLLISWLQSPSAVILEPQKIVWHCFHCFPIYFPWSDGIGCHDLRFLNVEL